MADDDWTLLAEPNLEFKEAYDKIKATVLSNRSIPEIREGQKGRKKQMEAFMGPKPDTVIEEMSTIPARDGYQIPVKLYKPTNPPARGSPLVVFLHGGGFCFCTADSEDLNCRNFVTQFGAVIVNPEYRLAPENPFPAAPNDAWDSLQWAAKNAQTLSANPTEGFIVGGVSAGGNLAAVLSLLARDLPLSPPLTGVALLIPGLMDTFNPPAVLTSLIRSPTQPMSAAILTSEIKERFNSHYKPNRTSTLSNVFAGYDEKGPDLFRGLPPVMLQVCGADPNRDEALVYERVLREGAGVKTKLFLYPGLPHSFQVIFPELKVSEGYFRDTTEGVRWLLGA